MTAERYSTVYQVCNDEGYNINSFYTGLRFQYLTQRNEEGNKNNLERHGLRTNKDCEVGVVFLLTTGTHISRVELQGCEN